MPRRGLKKKTRSLRRKILTPLARAALGGISRLPRPVARGLGWGAGELARHFCRSERRRILEHLRLAFGDRWTPRQRQVVARGVFRHFGTIAADLMVMQRWGPERCWDEIPFEGWDRVEDLVAEVQERGRGAIVLTGHLGCWELAAMLGNLSWDPVEVIARRYEDPGATEILETMRTNLGVSVVYQDESIRRAVGALQRNGVLGMLPDVDAKRVPGIFVDFFGRPAYTPVTPANLSRRLGSPIVITFILRDGPGYRAVVRGPLWPEEYAGAENPDRALTLAWSRIFEEEIRRCPDQWIWNHQRWRTTPEIVARRQAQAAERRAAAG